MDGFFNYLYSSPYPFIGLLLFAVAAAVLYVWGLKKQRTQQEELMNMLLNNASLKVVKYLKENEKITKNEMAKLVAGVKASEFYSKKKAVVVNEREFTSSLVDFMLKKDLVRKEDKWYYLSK